LPGGVFATGGIAALLPRTAELAASSLQLQCAPQPMQSACNRAGLK
jgi:hypothetical protein